MDIQQRDASYRRRIALISTLVVVSLSTVVFFAQRYARLASPKYVGWKGELELLPEITIEPEVAATQAAPAPRPVTAREKVALDVAEHSEFETTPPVESKDPRMTQPDLIDLQAHGAALSEATLAKPAVSYSATYVILRMIKPKYPPHEQAAGIEGNVTVQLLVDEQGMVAEASVLSLVGPESFQESALAAVRQFEFQPPTENGEPTSMWIKFVIKFRMYQ